MEQVTYYEQCGLYIAHIGRQAIWEAHSFTDLLRGLLAKGYKREQLVWSPHFFFS